MKKKTLFALLLTIALVHTGCSSDDDQTVYTVELPSYSAGTVFTGDTEDVVKSWTEEGVAYTQTALLDQSARFEFDCISASWGMAGGFAFANLTTGDQSAVTGKGVKNQTYLSSYYNEYMGFDVAINFKNEGKSSKYQVKGLYLTNSRVAYSTISEGDNFGAKKFEQGDWYKVTIYNHNKTASVEAFLADFREGKSEIVNNWKWVDLTPLGETTGLKFELSSSDSNEYGMLTPCYFCIDGITITE